MKQVHRKENVTAGDAVLHLFDIIPLDKFQEGKFAVKQSGRTAWLKQWYEEHMNLLPNVAVLDHAVVDLDTEHGQKVFSMYNKSAVENGYEGIMIKDLDAPYECKRSTAWLKLKPFIEVSLEVIEIEEGTGRNVGRLGAFVCAGDDDGKRIKVNVGSGFSDANRDSFWASRDQCIGNIVEVRADAVTQNQDGSYSLRFPRFLRFRGFVPGEKI
jgi:DNA ligase-1